MKKKFDFSAEMNDAESIKATQKNEYLEEEKRLLKVNVKSGGTSEILAEIFPVREGCV